ncbi:helix-turn-helix domain-containing protein [Neobacillus sp. NRS-1170]|uniref:helix-turn-helix domain-containing protein n=1 Tax=Neobacillus sp. NRS-1170 TaxID=3233898 RepID=UPI003D2D2EB0
MNDFYILQPFDKRKFVETEILTTPEAMELLEVSRGRLNQLVNQGKLNPVKKSGAITLFLKDDLIEKKKELVELRKKYRPFDY